MPNVIETSDAAGSTATAYTLNVGDIAQGQLTAGGDAHDWYRVNLVAGQTYTFAEVGTGTNNLVDSYLRLYASNGSTLLASNDDGLPNANSVFTYTATTSGAYYLDAGSYNSAYSGQYGLTVAQGSRPSFDIQMGAGVLDKNDSWSGTPGTGANVTFGFRQSAATYVVAGHNIATFDQVTATQMTAIQTALQFCSDVCNITFSAVNPGGYTNSAAILFADYTDFLDNSGAFAFGPGSTAASSAAGDVWLNTESVSRTSLPYSSYSFFAIVHEIGHALGLSHPGLYNATPGQTITYGNNAQFVQDTNQWTVMSYFEEGNTGAEYSGYAVTPLILDIYAFQQIYGANMTTRTGDTVYGFGSNAGAVYTATASAAPYAYSIWDAGGADTINMAGYSQAQTINLNAGAFSNTGGLTANVSIALGAVIENATGGSGADTLIGNGVANLLVGNAGNDRLEGFGGNDTLYGGADSDTAVYHAARAVYSISQNADGSLRISGGSDGADTVYQVEFFQFTDRTNPYALSELVLSASPSRTFAPPAQWTQAGPGSDGTWRIGDFDGDGKDDIFRYGGGSGADMFLSSGSAFVHDKSWTPAGFGIDNTWHLGDFNGDGKDDIFRYMPQQSGADMFLSNGAVFVHDKGWTPAGFGIDGTWHIGDFNGDGKDDIFRYIPQWSGAEMFLSTGSAFVYAGSWTPAGFGADNTWHIGDFNGDGKDDIFRYLGGTSGAQMFLSDGSKFVFDGSWTSELFGDDDTWHIGDFDGDGKDDIFRYLDDQPGEDVFLSNGSAFVYDGIWSDAAAGVDGTWHVGDFNGDAASDAMRILANGVDILI